MPIVTDGLKGYWHYQQGFSETTLKNLSPNTAGSYDAVFEGSPVLTDEGIDVNVANLIIAPSVEIDGTDFTIEVRGNLYTNPISGAPVDSYLVVNSTTHRIVIDSNGYVDAIMGGGRLIRTPSGIVGPGEFATVSVVFHSDDEYADVYINGTHYEYDEFGDANINVELRIGGNPGGYQGIFKFLRIYDRALSEVEIQQNTSVGDNVGLPDEEPPEGKVIEVAFDLQQSIYENTVTNFDTRQTIYENRITDFDMKQVIYEDFSVLFDVLQQFVRDEVTETSDFDIRLEIYKDDVLSFDIKQAYSKEVTGRFDLKQALYKRESVDADVYLVIYADTVQDFALKQLMFENTDAVFDMLQIFIDSDASLIGTIRLEGKIQLDVYLVGERKMNVNLKGVI